MVLRKLIPPQACPLGLVLVAALSLLVPEFGPLFDRLRSEARSQVQEELGLTMLFISHDLAVVRALSHKLLVLKSGRVVEYGDAAGIFNTPKHDYTRELLGAALFYSQ